MTAHDSNLASLPSTTPNRAPAEAPGPSPLSDQAVVAVPAALAAPKAAASPQSGGRLLSWPLMIPLVALAVLFAPVIIEAGKLWLTDEYSTHGLFIPFMAGLLVWWKRDELARTPKGTSSLGWALLLPGILLEMLAWHAQIRMIAMLSLVPTLLGLTFLLAGRDVARILRFPILFLVFMAPLPRDIVLPVSFPIQVISTRSACWGAQQVGVPLVVEGFNVATPKATVEVAESCSGFKNVLTLIVFSSFYAALYPLSLWKSALLVALSIPTAICCNVIRVMSLILAGAWGSESAVHRMHDISGIAVLGLCFAMLAGWGKLLGCKKMRYTV